MGVRVSGGAPSGVLLAEFSLASPAASFDFTDIPATYRHLHVVLSGRSATAAASDNVLVRLNNDSGAGKYAWQYVQALATTPTASFSTSDTAARVGVVAAASATAGDAGIVDAIIGDYRGSAFRKGMRGSGGIGGAHAVVYASKWNDTSAVTRLTLLLGSGANFVAGSVASLYGLR